jgi:hypothetical protein
VPAPLAVEDPEALLDVKGVQGLLEDYLGEELDAFPPELKYPAVALLGQMVTEAGTRNVLSAESLIEKVRDEEEIPAERLGQALDRLERESKLVRRERRRDLYLYEITSEFLLPWISRRREDLVRAQDRRRERRRLILFGSAIIGLLAVVTIVALLAAWALAQRSDARRAATSARSLALAITSDGQRSSHLDAALLLGLEAYRLKQSADAESSLNFRARGRPPFRSRGDPAPLRRRLGRRLQPGRAHARLRRLRRDGAVVGLCAATSSLAAR